MSRTRSPSRPVKCRSTTTAANPNHHLWQHGKNWWVYCAVNPTPRTKDKLRRSLCTECVETARLRRDELFRRLQAEGMLGRIRAGVRPAKAPPVVVGPVASGLTWQQRTDAMLAVVLALTPANEDFPAPVVGVGQGKLQLCCS